MKYIDKKIAKKFEKAISFLVKNINETGTNPKPVILHSLQVAFLLQEKSYKPLIIESAILHDIVEDSSVTLKKVEKEFGLEIKKLIQAVSYNESISNWTEKYTDMFKRIEATGKDALILKCADIICNSYYIHLIEDIEFQKKLIKKIGDFLKISEEIKTDQIWKDLKSRFDKEQNRISTLDSDE